MNTLLSCVNLWKLERYDSLLHHAESTSDTLESAPPVNRNPYPEPVITLRYNSKGNAVRWLQYELNKRGYRLVVDGKYGVKTLEAVKAFQKTAFPDRPEEWDGIVGPKTREKLLSS